MFAIREDVGGVEEEPDNIEHLLQEAQEIIHENKRRLESFEDRRHRNRGILISLEKVSSEEIQRPQMNTVEVQTIDDSIIVNEPETSTPIRQSQSRPRRNNSDDVILIDEDTPYRSDCLYVSTRRQERRRLSRHSPFNGIQIEITLNRSGSNTNEVINDSVQTIEDSVSSVEDDRNKSKIKMQCPVCMESAARREPTSTLCGHIFCKPCILHAIKISKKCPLCNRRLNRKQVHPLFL